MPINDNSPAREPKQQQFETDPFQGMAKEALAPVLNSREDFEVLKHMDHPSLKQAATTLRSGKAKV